MFFTNSMSSFGARAPYASSFFVRSWSSCTSSSADSMVGSIVRSRPRSTNTASRSVSGGNAPRSRSARSCAHRVAARRADEQHEEREPLRLVEPAGDAEVHQHGAAVGPHHEVAAVQVAVEDAVEHRALHERHEPRVQHRFGVDAGVLHRGHVVPRDAVEPFHHEHASGDERRVRAGHDRRALVGLGEHARDVEHVLRLEAEVELLDDRLREQLDERGRVRERGDRDAADRGAARATTSRGCLRARAARPAGAAPSRRPLRRCAAAPRAPARSTPPRSASGRSARTRRRASGRGRARRRAARRRTARAARGRGAA